MAESVNAMLKPSCTATTAVLAAEECQCFLGSLDLEPGLSGLRRGRMVRSGDVSDIDDDGSVTVIGRLKDVVTRKCGANSSPEIEGVLL